MLDIKNMENSNVTVLICKGKSFTSKAISLFTGSSVTHTAFKIVINDNIFIAESQKNGFELKTIKTWKEQFKYDYYEFQIPSTYNCDKIEAKIFDKLSNVPYDFRLFILRYPKHILSKIFGNKKRIQSVKNENKREICSESVSNCLGWSFPENYLPVDVYNKIILENWLKIK